MIDPISKTQCSFGGGTWSAADARTLTLRAPCADGRSRDIVLRLSPTPALSKPESMTVDGNAGWRHPGFDWAFSRCTSTTQCSPP